MSTWINNLSGNHNVFSGDPIADTYLNNEFEGGTQGISAALSFLSFNLSPIVLIISSSSERYISRLFFPRTGWS